MAGGEVLANIILSGDDDAADGFENVADEMEHSAGSATLLNGRLSSLAGELRDTVMPARMASSSIESVGDEATQTGAQASAAAGGAGLLSTALLGMGTAGALASSSLTGVAASISAVTLALAPLLPALSLAAGAVGGLAIAFGAIMGSGLLAFNEETKGLKKTLSDLQSELKPLIVSFGSQFIPLIQDALDAVVPFVKSLLDAVGNLEPFTDALRALGGAAFEIIPQIVELFVNVARQALPALTEVGDFIASNLVPALDSLFEAGRNAGGPVARLGMALFDLGEALAPVAGLIGRVALQAYDLATGFVSAGASLTSGLISGIATAVRTLTRWGQTIKSVAVPAIMTLSRAWQGQGGRILSVAMGMFEAIGRRLLPTIGQFGKTAGGVISTVAGFWDTHGSSILSMIRLISWNLSEGLIQAMAAVASVVGGDLMQARTAFQDFKTAVLNVWRLLWPQIKRLARAGLTAAWNWVKGPGLSMAKAALSTLATGALAALQFGREQIVPLIRSGLSMAWTWVRGPGVTLAKDALGFLATQALNAFEFGREEIIPAIRTGLGMAWTWVRETGVQKAKGALGFLATQALNAFEFGREEIVPAIRDGLEKGWTWVRETGVQKAKSALGFLGTKALDAFEFAKEDVVPAIRDGLEKGWTWVRETGVQKAKDALSFLGDKALGAFEFAREDIVPAIRDGLEKGWTWVRETGITGAKDALGFLGDQAVKAFNLSGEEGEGGLIPETRSAIQGMNQWIQTAGVPMTMTAFERLGNTANSLFRGLNLKQRLNGALRGATNWIKTNGMQMFKGAFRGIGPNIGNAVVGYINIIQTTFAKGLPKIRKWLKNNGMRIVREGFRALGRGLRRQIMTMLGIAGMVGQAFVSTINGIRDWLKDGGARKLKNGFNGIITGIVSFIKNDAWGLIKGAFEFLWEAPMEAFEAFARGLIYGSAIPEMFNAIARFIRNFDLAKAARKMLGFVTTAFSDFATDVIGGGSSIIKSLIGDIASYIRGGAKSDVVSAFESLGRGIEGAMESAAEWAVDGFNGIMPDSFGLPSVTIPRVSMQIDPISVAGQQIYGGGSVGVGPFGPFGGQSFDIPQLAEGGIATGPTLAQIGEGSEPEAVLPLSKLEGMLAGRSGSAGSGGSNGDVYIDQTIESGAFQGVAMDEVLEFVGQSFDDWMDEIKREIEAKKVK